ncbi:MAG: RsmB/NOP family class I SAM-dependent RNA methyltransferase [Hasllibacter sp.]
MTPGARVAAAIGVVDAWLGGEGAERALTRWARGARYAGSKDRAAVRDLVYDALRRRRSAAALGGGGDGRAILLGLLRGRGEDPGLTFGTGGHAPGPVRPDEAGRPPEGAEALDLPDWLAARLAAERPGEDRAIAEALRHRAPVFLRANLARGDVADALAALAADSVTAERAPLSATALRVVDGRRALVGGAALGDGLVEPQDAASQAVADLVPAGDGARVLDLCAGGGGKALAIAARAPGARVAAWDAAPARMRDLPARAARLGVRIERPAAPESGAPWDAVLCDAPCSGSGTWRRDPEGKWALTPERLEALIRLQGEILDRAARLVRPGGAVVHATCSVLPSENEGVAAAFLRRHDGWRIEARLATVPQDGPDGFGAHLLRAPGAGGGTA